MAVESKFYLCTIVGAGTDDDPQHACVAGDPAVEAWSMQQLNANWGLVNVLGDHAAINLADAFLLGALDDALVDLTNAQRSALIAAVQRATGVTMKWGTAPLLAGNRMRAVVRAIGRRAESQFDENLVTT